MKSSRKVGYGKTKLVLLAGLVLGLASVCPVLAGGGESRYYVNDHLATTVGITDAAGEIATIEADAFGAPVAGGEAAGRFTGKPYDADLGAYVFPFRNYRADEARWMSADPSGFPDGVNGQAYKPIFSVELDPWGLATLTVYTRTSGNSSSWGSTGHFGHAWLGVTTDDGQSTVAGNYPDEVHRGMDTNTKNGTLPPESQHTFDISDAQAQAIIDQISDLEQNHDYNAWTNNCVDMVERALSAASIEHPSFNSPLGISWP